MSYEVLARKWRPQTFDDVVGQDHITRTLQRAVESGRLSHAYLFAGPRGCGKTSTARILAKVINCAEPKAGNPCNACPSCLGVIQGKNLDVIEIDGASHTGVAEVRDLQESIGYVASQYANKIYIIDEVHMLSTHAFNALLKTLEEPPAHVYFVFATTAPHKIPDTIKSRCQRHHFKRLEITEIAGQLERVCKAEQVEAEPEALRLLARKAEGSLRDGESLLDQCITAAKGKVTTESVRDTLGLLDQEMVIAFLETVADRRSTDALRLLDTAIRQGVDIEELLNGLIEGFRDLMLLASSEDLASLVFRSKSEIDALKALLSRLELADLVTIVERLCNSATRLKFAAEPRILLESVLVDLALLDRQVEIRELVQELNRTGGAASGGPPQAPKPRSKGGRRASATETSARLTDARFPPSRPAERVEPAEPPRQEPVESDAELEGLDYRGHRQLWNGFVAHVRQKKVALGLCLISATLQSMDEKTVVLRFSKGFGYQKSQVDDPASLRFLKSMMKKYFGRELELVCLTEGEEAAAARQPGTSAERAPKRAIENQPIVKKILTDFDGEIIRYHPQ